MSFRAYRLGARWRIVCKGLRARRQPSEPGFSPISHQCQSVIKDYPRLFIPGMTFAEPSSGTFRLEVGMKRREFLKSM
ncbi:MAG TPA: hypothetical protein VK512_16125, partial [Xanthobacteraceae bacterium]|nr:hypothetical protein [Xanthobacteraceae bacterium]